MNKRIRELAEQAGFMVDQSGCIMVCFTSNGDSEVKKFAELIIRQCAGIDFRHKVGMTPEMAEAFIAKGHAP